MKFKSIFLLLIFSCSLVPLRPVEAEEALQRSPEDAIALMYISDAVLLNEIVDDETSSTSKVSAGTKPDISSDETTDLINQMINATKQQRNDHDRKCRETVEIYRQQGKTCEVDQTNAYCKSKRAELTAKIAALRKKRGGDNRKGFTKLWHGIKRTGARFWHKIGPLGRNFLQKVGPQALKIVLAGGPGTDALLKNLLKHTAKNMARQRAKQIGIQALQRILKVQIEVATAAGVDICEEEEEGKTEDESETQDQEQKNPSDLDLPTTGVWDLTCQHTHELIIVEYPDITWKVKITWDSNTFAGQIDGTSTKIVNNDTRIAIWNEEGAGDVTPDGFLWGDSTEITKYTYHVGTSNPYSEERTYDSKWLGAISEDLTKVCLRRVGASQIDLDWLRERGRQEMLDNPGGWCEGLCFVK